MQSSCAHARSSVSREVLHERNRPAGSVAVDDSDEDEQSRRGHQGGDQDTPPDDRAASACASPPDASARRAGQQKRHCGRCAGSGVMSRQRDRSGLEAGFLVDGFDRLLADARLVLLVHRRRATFFHAAFSSAVSVMISVLPDALTAASASSFSFLAMSFAYLVASFIAPSSVVRMSAGRPSQNFLLAMTA